MVICGTKPWVNLLGKMSIFQVFELFFYRLERRFFVVEYRKGHFPGWYCRKKKDGKMAIFGPKPWVIPFEKMSIFWLFERLFYSLERCFFVVEYRKRHFPGLYCLKKICWKNGHFFFQNHGLTSLEKCQFFDFLKFFFYSLKRCFFLLKYRKRRFPGLYCLKKKLEKWKFLDQSHGFGKMSIFRLFELLVFMA